MPIVENNEITYMTKCQLWKILTRLHTWQCANCQKIMRKLQKEEGVYKRICMHAVYACTKGKKYRKWCMDL